MRWTGTPYIEWETSIFGQPVLPGRVLEKGVLVYEGLVRENRFRIEKAILLDFSGDQILWRRAISPGQDGPGNVLETLSIPLPKGESKRELILAWVQGDVLRVQNGHTGQDVWNRPGCRYPQLDQNRLAAVCFDRISILEPENGRIKASLQLSFSPSGMWLLGEYFILLDQAGNLYIHHLKKVVLPRIPMQSNVSSIKVVQNRLLILSTSRGNSVLQALSLGEQSWKQDWKAEFGPVPELFWIHESGEMIIFPIGFDCLSARKLKTGEEAWISCGIHTENPPAWDEDGMFLLSSRKEKGHRPLLYVDGTNGLQTPLFRSMDSQFVEPFLASTIASGSIVNGLLYGVHTVNKLFALRVAAPDDTF